MRISDFDYDLPAPAIAKFPPKTRGQSRLLTLNRGTGAVQHRNYEDLAALLQPGDLVVLNDTKVIKARLTAVNQAKQDRELLLVERHEQQSGSLHEVMYRGKLHEGQKLRLKQRSDIIVTVKRVKPGGLAEISCSKNLWKVAELFGEVPLPPYLQRQATPTDRRRYQTVFAKQAGSVAAPTASLNLTKNLVDKLTTRGIGVCYLTLHVGLGTFLPVRTDEVAEHQMHSEFFVIPPDTIRQIRQTKQAGGRVVAVGTTVCRTLEFAGQKLLRGPAKELSGEADIFIYPGYQFKIVDVLLTNFHAPRSTVLLLAAAFAGQQNLYTAYQTALREDYKFLSYGDSMLIY